MEDDTYELGMVGLGVMGRNMLLNMADAGHTLAGYDRDTDKVRSLRDEADEDHQIGAAESIEEFVDKLRTPRAVMMSVPAGDAVDSVINELRPLLDDGDILIDAGNSHFADTERRQEALADAGIAYLGVGVSGGEYGARHGPSIMPGGPKDAYERVRPLFEDMAAKVDGQPCVTYLGPGSAGHYVKMVHNGIEYGLMELLAESYDLFSRGMGLSNEQLHDIYADWNREELGGFLMQITSRIFAQPDSKGAGELIDAIKDVAHQKGTGMWTSQNAMEMQVPVPTIDMAVVVRNLSTFADQRRQASERLGDSRPSFDGEQVEVIEQMRHALHAAMIVTYAQGMALLRVASHKKDYGLDLADVATIWRGGCIIRSRLLEAFRKAYREQPELPNLLLDASLGETVASHRGDLERIAALAGRLRIPAPAMMASLAYVDGFGSERLPTNLVQAQRDFFGSHTYERVDQDGSFHTDWPRGD